MSTSTLAPAVYRQLEDIAATLANFECPGAQALRGVGTELPDLAASYQYLKERVSELTHNWGKLSLVKHQRYGVSLVHGLMLYYSHRGYFAYLVLDWGREQSVQEVPVYGKCNLSEAAPVVSKSGKLVRFPQPQSAPANRPQNDPEDWPQDREAAAG